jgi:hypothetical protein
MTQSINEIQFHFHEFPEYLNDYFSRIIIDKIAKRVQVS